MDIGIILPHQLYTDHPLLTLALDKIYLVEEQLFFRQYAFHKQKIAYHRASMRYFAEELSSVSNSELEYINASDPRSDIRQLISGLSSGDILHLIDPTDDWIERRSRHACEKHGLDLTIYDSPNFINTREDLGTWLTKDKKKYFQTSWYKEQRKKRHILMDQRDEPLGGKWTFDTENRKPWPKKKTPPHVQFPDWTAYHEEANDYTEQHFSDNPGEVSQNFYYPIDRESALSWLDQFLERRFHEFGPYEDAIVAGQVILNHSVLTPMLNVGLLSPAEILDKSIAYALEHDVPINSTEGFVRQIMGWREFIRLIYLAKGREERTRNFWGFSRKIPHSFYDGTTGITPIDDVIRRVLRTGYCHHIERLMILGNFMCLCEFAPDEVYRWFMEMFIDAYDWVMVPNVYGMSQYADGGLMSTKPYISGSNYVIKMSNYSRGPWQETWDGLFWRFMSTHREFFLKNPRLGMLVRSWDKMSADKRRTHLDHADQYLARLDSA